MRGKLDMCAQAVRRVWAAFHRRGHHAGRLAARRRLGLFLLTFCTVGWRPAGGPASAAKPKLSDLVPEHRTRAVLLAAAQRGDTIAGVQPHKIKGTGQRVYVLELEEDFAVRSTGARSRWGIRGNPRGDEPYIHAEELRTIPADAMVWIKRLTAEEREAAHGAERYSREVEEVGGDAPRGRRMLGLTPEGVVWIANRSHRKLSDLTENNFVLKDPGGLAWYQTTTGAGLSPCTRGTLHGMATRYWPLPLPSLTHPAPSGVDVLIASGVRAVQQCRRVARRATRSHSHVETVPACLPGYM
jgi:hypothetical protein